MGSPKPEWVTLNADPGPRTVTVGADDESTVRTQVTETMAGLFGQPAAVMLTSSCTAALEASAALLDLRPGDEVIVPAFTFATTASAFAARGATIRFADVLPATGNVDPHSVAAKIGPRTRAVVCVHYAGVAADLDGLRGLIGTSDIDLVEDAAQGLFGSFEGRPLGTIGRFGCVSLHRTKNLSVGEGGVLIVNGSADVAAAHIALDKGNDRMDFEAGKVSSYQWAGLGSAGRMPEAAVRLLASELERAHAVQERRHSIWRRYRESLAAWSTAAAVQLPVMDGQGQHPAHIFFLLLPTASDRDPFVAHCSAAGVQAARHFGSLPSTTYGRSIVQAGDSCPVAEDFAARLVRIPLHDRLSDTDVERVIAAVTSWRPTVGGEG